MTKRQEATIASLCISLCVQFMDTPSSHLFCLKSLELFLTFLLSGKIQLIRRLSGPQLQKIFMIQIYSRYALKFGLPIQYNCLPLYKHHSEKTVHRFHQVSRGPWHEAFYDPLMQKIWSYLLSGTLQKASVRH